MGGRDTRPYERVNLALISDAKMVKYVSRTWTVA